MVKPITLSEYLINNAIPQVLADGIIKAYKAEKYYNDYNFCNICDKEMSENDHMHRSAFHFLTVCKEHHKYGTMYLLDLAKLCYRISEGAYTDEDENEIKREYEIFLNAKELNQPPLTIQERSDKLITGFAERYQCSEETIKNIIR